MIGLYVRLPYRMRVGEESQGGRGGVAASVKVTVSIGLQAGADKLDLGSGR